MIILLYGPNKYLLNKKLQEIIDHYQQKHQGLNLHKIDAEQSDFESFWHGFRQKSMFVKNRLTIIENILQNSDFKKNFRKNLQTMADDDEIIVALAAAEIKKTDQALVEKIKKIGKVQEFPKPSKLDANRWLAELNQNHNLQLSSESIRMLIDYMQDDWIKGQETAMRLSSSSDQEETIQNIIRLNEEIQAVDIFHLSSAISQGMKDKALLLTHRYFAQGGRPEGLLPLIIYQFRQLIIVRDLIEKGFEYHQVKQKSGLPAFVFNRVYRQSENLSMDRLRDIYRRIFILDYQLKTGQIDPRTGLDLFIAKI